MARETRALPGRWQRGLGAAKAARGKSVGTVSHRPLPGLPDEEGMARETRALPGEEAAGPSLPLFRKSSDYIRGAKTNCQSRCENR